ncbi:hypothetical protein BMS3Abin03_03030 [bacterium BMS3Abin03]|nr:hypothetical protein BMS3Abin03_03030 [bacterium BMS3Abin03]
MIKLNKILILDIFLIAGLFVSNIYGQSDYTRFPDINERIRKGEDLTYIVKYAFLNLGELRTVIEGKDTIDGKTIYKSITYIDSYDGLPFINLHQVYRSWFDSTLYPVFFEGLMYYDNDTSFTKYFFNEDSLVHIIKGSLNPTIISMDTVVNLKKRFQDGLSLLYFARYNFGNQDTIKVGCFINEDTSTTRIIYSSEREEISVDAVDYNIDCLKLEGETNFTGIFGLTGHFEGWFSNDKYSVPIFAKLNVLIGSVVVELMDWKDKTWQPPEYKE